MGSLLALPIAAGIALLSNKIADVGTLCKWIIAYANITLHRRQTKPRFDLYDFDSVGDPFKIGLLPPEKEVILESPQDESHLIKAADEVFFYGVNSSSECFMARVSRVCSDEADVGLYIKLRNGNTYETEKVRCLQQTSKSCSRRFTGGGLKMYYREPMRRWRIFFKGLLKETSGQDDTKCRTVYVKFGLQWRTSTDCFDALSDINCSDLATALAGSKWEGFLPDLTKFHDAVNSYSQGGVIRGEIHIDGVDEDIELYVFGEKIRYLGNATKVEGYRFSHTLGHVTKNGRIVHMTELHIPQAIKSLIFGYVITPEGKIESATNIKVKEGHLWNEKALALTLRTDETDFILKATLDEATPVYDCGIKQEYQLSISNIEFDLNTRTGRGILLKGHIANSQKRKVVKRTTEKIPKDIPLTVDFSDDVCQISDITGGKGSSLGKLTQLSKRYQNFIVPKGIVVTTAAYKKFITDDILKEIRNLGDALYGNTDADVREACERTMNSVIDADLPKTVQESIAEHLKTEFGGDAYHHKMFAIRSSATGEDNDDLSAAGQMETYLGVKKLDQIMLTVKKCWASQFSYVCTQYKRQNGQELNSPMAVVIQEMVQCDVAGVLFTCDPLTGNPTLMTITANYGFGESVVSGSEEPDTIILERSSDESLRITEKIIGSKSHRIIIKDENGPIQDDVPEQQRKECALTDRLLYRLGKIAMYIEKSYGSERDVEWGVLKENFYIFQSRPVTANNEETDYEIDHESDEPMRIEKEYFTVANVGEVMPGAMSTLGLNIMIHFFNSSMQRKEFTMWKQFAPKYCLKGISNMYNHTMLLAIGLVRHLLSGEAFMKSGMIGLFGRPIEDAELFELVKERFQYQKEKKLSFPQIFDMLRSVLLSSRLLKNVKRKYEKNKISFESYCTSTDLYQALVRSCSYPFEALFCHLICTNKSSVANMFLLNIIEKAKGGIDTDVYNDISEILSSINEVESADVPAAMESLAYHIRKDISPENFQNMSTEDAENWLMTSTCGSSQAFRDFLKKHGHRCLREFDMRTTTWGENPKLLVELLQNLTKSTSEGRAKKKTKSFQDIMPKLKAPLSTKAKIIMRFLLMPLCRSGVQGREASKSLLIRVQHEWRKGYKKLAKLMVSEGRIPDEDLLYFMSVIEIQELLKNRSPKIIARALHRRRRYPVLDSYIFPEITSGVPKPVNVDHTEIINNDENFFMKGMPVSQGVAKGFVRVALSLNEAAHLKQGEILLTYSTDIGWTPYFPVLAGVVTEIGGLISHGAVVSREYGLPCVAGLHGATRQFRTGDYVLLDANKGILQKLPLPD